MLGAEPIVLYLALALAAADVFTQQADAIARGIDRFDLRNLDQISFALASLVAAWIALEILDCALLGTLVALAVARLAVMAVFGALTLRASGIDLSVDRRELGESLRVGVQGWLQTLLGKLHERADVMIMAALRVDPVQIAVYAVAVSVVDRLRVVPDSISVALLPQLATSAPAEAGPYTARVTRHVFFWVVLGSVVLALVAPALMPLIFGAPYAASVAPLLVMLPATVMLLLRTIPSNYFNATGNPGFIVRVQAVSLAVNVAANLWAIPRYGVIGAAWASVLSYGVEAAACLWAFRSRTRCGLRETLVLNGEDLASYRSGVRRLLSASGGEP
jgi:O-antigen/teichoic acid export membrane protein